VWLWRYQAAKSPLFGVVLRWPTRLSGPLACQLRYVRAIRTFRKISKKFNIRGVIKRRALPSIFDQLGDVTSSVMVYVIVTTTTSYTTLGSFCY